MFLSLFILSITGLFFATQKLIRPVKNFHLLLYVYICLKKKIDVIVLAKSNLIGVLMHLRHSVNIK